MSFAACHRLLLALVLSVAVARAVAPDARELGLPYFDTFEPRDYQGHTQVWSAVEDAAGIVYFGNYSGVLTYDGARWGRIDLPGTSFVRALAIDADDTLWLGGVNEIGYAKTDANGTRTFVSLREKLPEDARVFGDVWRVVLTPRGPLFQTNTRLLRWEGERFNVLPLKEAGAWQLTAAGDTVWVSHNQAGWFQLKETGDALALVPHVRPAAFDGSSLIFALPGAQPGEFIFGTSRAGLARGDGKTFSPLSTEIDDIIKQRRLYRAARLDDGRILLTTLQAGAFILDLQGRLITKLDEAAGLPDNGTLNALLTRRGALWVCLQRGMVRVDPRPWVSWFGPARGAPRTTLQPPVRFQGQTYLCSDSGLLRLVPATAQTPARLEPVPEFPTELFGLTVVDDVLIGYGDSGIFEWRGAGEPKKLPGIGGTTFGFQPATGQPGRWFSLTNGELHSFRHAGGEWTAEGPVPSLKGVRSLVSDATGTWWLGTPSDGVMRVTFPHASATSPGAPAITLLTAGNGLPEGHGWARVSVDARGPLLRCEKGFFRFNEAQGKFEPTSEFGAGFANGSLTTRSMTQGDPRDGRWIVARPAGEAELVTTLDVGVVKEGRWRSVRLPHVARIDDVSDALYEADADLLWLAGQSGLVRLDLARWRQAPPDPVPTVLLRRVESAGGTPLPLTGGWNLPFAQRSLQFQFASPDLSGDRDARYESTLLGDGDPLVVTAASPNRDFSALGAGDYTLQVRARAANGAWSAPRTISFTILPPWWLSGWAWVLYALFAAAGVTGVVRWRTGALRQRAAALEATVAERTEDLRRSNAELTRLHQLELDEKIAAKLGEEKARLEVLRYQLNPHFLFNALTSVCAHLPPSLAKAREIIEQLVDFCQLTLFRPAGGENPTVAQEMKMLRAYLDIEQTRWGDLLQVTLDVAPESSAEKIPPLLLLPLVENALKYGRATSPGPVHIRLRAQRDAAGALVIEIANTGEWVEPGHRSHVPSLGIGLENLRQRLQRYYPDAHTFTSAASDGWVTFTLRFASPARTL